MRLSPALVVVLALSLASSGALGDGLIRDLQGQWRGASVEAEGIDAALLQPRDLDLTLTATDDGFRARWTSLERAPDGGLRRQPVEARFGPTGRPGVYAFESEPGSLLARLFASPATGNPLQGETLLWARTEDETLHLYSLVLHPDGGFDLDRWAHALEDGALRRVLTRRTEHGTVVVAGRLERQSH
jgi:hypothetical protein